MKLRKNVKLILTLGGVIGLVVGSVAMAQGIDWNPQSWGSNPVVAAGVLAGAVAWFRLTNIGKWFDGPTRVGALTLAVGGAFGLGLDSAGLITVLPFADWTFPLRGLAYGASLAVFDVFGLALWNYGTSKIRPVNVTTPTVIEPLGFTGAGTPIARTAVEFILEYVKSAVKTVELPAAVLAVLPLITQLLQSPVVLNDETRSDLQAKVISLLRKAGLLGVDLV